MNREPKHLSLFLDFSVQPGGGPPTWFSQEPDSPVPVRAEPECCGHSLSLLCNCNICLHADELLNYRICCSGKEEGENGVVLGIYGDGEDPEVIDATKSAGLWWRHRWWPSGEEVLRNWFMLNWTASVCSVCEASGGKCVFDAKIYYFRRYCPEGPRAWICRTGTFICSFLLCFVGQQALRVQFFNNINFSFFFFLCWPPWASLTLASGEGHLRRKKAIW